MIEIIPEQENIIDSNHNVTHFVNFCNSFFETAQKTKTPADLCGCFCPSFVYRNVLQHEASLDPVKVCTYSSARQYSSGQQVLSFFAHRVTLAGRISFAPYALRLSVRNGWAKRVPRRLRCMASSPFCSSERYQYNTRGLRQSI